jgi:hypothetical protein
MLSSGRNVFEELGRDYTLIALTDDAAAVTAFRDAAQAVPMPLHPRSRSASRAARPADREPA